jgi:predicted nucleic acid-binding protein
VSNQPIPSIFLDTSALFAAIFSAAGGARALLHLGGAGAVQLWISLDVLAELEENLRAKAPHHLADLAAVLDLSRVEIVDPPDVMTVQQCQRLLQYDADAVVLAAAVAAGVDYFVTLDRQHFLDNRALTEAMAFPLGTPGDCLAWFRQHWIE